VKAVSKVEGRVAVLDRPNVDTDQIIPKQFLKRIERTGYGQYAFFDWRFDDEGDERPGFELNQPQFAGARILLAGRNFGCGSSREHAPIAIGAAGGAAVVAESYARIFFRNCVATGELYPVETATRLVDEFKTGDEAELDLDASTITNLRTGKQHQIQSLGDARPVIDAGGLFEYARQTGMIPKAAAPDQGAAVPLNQTIED